MKELDLVTPAPDSSPKSSPKTDEWILDLVRRNASITTEQLRAALGITKRATLKQIDKLKPQGRLLRIGPAKGGHWEILLSCNVAEHASPVWEPTLAPPA